MDVATVMSPTGLRNPVMKPQDECSHHLHCGEQRVDLTVMPHAHWPNDWSITRQERDVGAKKPSG